MKVTEESSTQEIGLFIVEAIVLMLQKQLPENGEFVSAEFDEEKNEIVLRDTDAEYKVIISKTK